MERLTQRLRTGEVLMASDYEEKYTEQEWISMVQDRLAAYEVDGVNLDFNHYGVVNFKTPFSAEKQLCLSCAARVCNFVENGAKMDGGDDGAAD